MIDVNIWLYGKPAWDMDIEGEEKFDPVMFKERGNNLKEWLYEVSDIVKKLQSDGWNVYGALYDLTATKESVKTMRDAKKELKRLGVDLKSVSLNEWEDEERDED